MPTAPKTLSDPALHKQWSTAKDTAEKEAKGSSQKEDAKHFAALTKTAFKNDLGPNLDKFPKLYPDYVKMEKLVNGLILPTINAYSQAISKSDLSKPIGAKLAKALKSIADEQTKRLEEAKLLISQDLSLGIKESKKKTPPPIIVFKHPDLLRVISGKVGKLTNLEISGNLGVEVIIDDAEILDKFPESKEYANASQKIKDAGDFDLLTTEIANAIKTADANVGKGKSVSDEQKVFEKAVDTAIAEAVVRAAAEAGRLGKLRAKVGWAKVKRAGKIVLLVGGIAGGIAGLALTPFTAGVSTIAGCLALAKSAVTLGKELADVASSAEMMANGIAKDLNTLKKQYFQWLQDPRVKEAGGVSNKMGMAELAKSGVNALLPTMITTINSVKGDAGTYVEKIDNLEDKADRLADNLTEWIKKQEVADKIYHEIAKLGRDALNDTETKLLLGTLKKLESTKQAIMDLINKVQTQNARVKKNRTDAAALNKQIGLLDEKNPTWSKVGIVLFETTAGVAFALAGNINAPDPYKFAESAMKIVGPLGTAKDSLEQAHALCTGLKEAVEKRKKK